MTPENAGPTFAQFFDAWELFGGPAIAGAVAGAMLGAIGVYVVLRRLIFLAAALSQAAGLGVATAMWMTSSGDAPPSPAIINIGAATSTGIAALPFFGRGQSLQRKDGWMGLIWLIGAAGALAIGSRLGESDEIQSLLFGSAVVVLPEQLHMLIAVAIAVLVAHVWLMRGLIQVSVDVDGARVRGLPVRFLNMTLLVTLAVAISVSTRVLGALPVFAFSVLPAMAALRVSKTVPRAIVVATVCGAVSGFVGYLFAFRWALPVGASQALVAASWVIVAEVVTTIRGRE